MMKSAEVVRDPLSALYHHNQPDLKSKIGKIKIKDIAYHVRNSHGGEVTVPRRDIDLYLDADDQNAMQRLSALMAKLRHTVPLKKKEGGIGFVGEKRIPERTINIGDEVVLESGEYNIHVKVEEIDGQSYVGTISKSVARPETFPDKICFKYENIYTCAKAQS